MSRHQDHNNPPAVEHNPEPPIPNMGSPHDENLPEVVVPQNFETDPKSSPQVVTGHSAKDQQWQDADRGKIHVSYDTSPKFPDDHTYVSAWKSNDPQPMTASTQDAHPPWESLPAGDDTTTNAEEPPKQKRICGLRRRTFIICVVVAILVIAGAIGGGVGGTRGKPTPRLFLNNGTAPPGLALQAFNETVYLGEATRVIQEEGFIDLNMTARSYVWVPDNTGCCLTFCTNTTNDVGYWCNPRRRPEASEPFNRVYIWCGGNTNGKLDTTCS